MALNEDVRILSSKGGYQERWKDLFQANLDALFELALLLTADPREAEANLALAIDALDCSKPPEENASKVLQIAVARQSIRNAGPGFAAVEARSMLQSALLPLFTVERLP